MATRNLSVTKDTLLAYNGTNLGGGDDEHLITGYHSGYRFRSLIRCGMDWTGVVQITKMELFVKRTSGIHVSLGGDPTVHPYRLTASFSENNGRSSGDSPPGSGWNGNATDYAFTSWTDDGDANQAISSGWNAVDITKIADKWAPASVLKSTGGPGDAASNYGIALLATPEIDTSETAEFFARESSNDPYMKLTYTTNTAPYAPTPVSPTSGEVVTNPSELIEFTGGDPDVGDEPLSYDLQVDQTTANLVVPDWASPAMDYVDSTAGLDPDGSFYVGTPIVGLTRGNWYAWRSRFKDLAGQLGPWSVVSYFRFNALPVGTPITGSGSDLPYIHNLASDLTVWTGGGAHAKARLAWNYSDADGDAQVGATVKIWAASTGGSPLETYFHSGPVQYANLTLQLVNGTTYYWSVVVTDAAGESGAESARQAFHVRWGQAIYEHQPTGGASSGSWQHVSSEVAAGTQKGFLYGSSASSGTGGVVWKTSPGAVTPNVYAKILARIATNVSGTNPSLDTMTFSYIASAAQPDKWVFQPGSDWTLDADVRRFGTQSLGLAVSGSGNRYAYPFRVGSGDDIVVQPSTEYTFSAFVKTDGALAFGTAQLRVYPEGQTTGELTAWYTDTERRETTDSSVDWDGGGTPEGWLRLVLRLTTGAATTRIRPMLFYEDTGASAGDQIWWDAVKFEEGLVATAWAPGFVADAVVLDAGGIAVDGLNGGIFRLRGVLGGVRDEVALGPHALVFFDTEMYSDAAGEIRVVAPTGSGARIRAEAPSGQRSGLSAEIATDSVARALLSGDATLAGLELGGGSGAADVLLDRAAANTLRLDSGDRFRWGGTSFPTTGLATDDHFFRTDLRMEFVYDGTRWLSTTLFEADSGTWASSSTYAIALNVSTTTVSRAILSERGGTDVWIDSIEVREFVGSGGTALSATHKWVATVYKISPANALTSLGTVTFDSGASSEWHSGTIAVGAVLGTTALFPLTRIDWAKTGSPGNLTVTAPYKVLYRVVAT